MVDPATVVDPLHSDYLFRGRECREKAVIPDSKFPFIRANEPLKVVLRVGRRTLQTFDDSPCDSSIQGPEVTNRRVGPLDLPRRQRPSRFLTS